VRFAKTQNSLICHEHAFMTFLAGDLFWWWILGSR